MELRLNRFLAQAGVSSRRGADELLRSGRVAVNGAPVTTPGARIDPAVDRVTLDGRPVSAGERIFHGAFHKPPGVVTTLSDPHARRDLRGFLGAIPVRVFPVGRLDEDSEGLLLVTNDGDLAYRLTHPRYQVEKEYEAAVRGAIPRDLCARLTGGVALEDGPARAVRAEWLEGERSAAVGRARVRVVLTEGRKREVRRMFAALGLEVTGLVRTRVGTVSLGRLAPGAWRELEAAETAALRELVGLSGR